MSLLLETPPGLSAARSYAAQVVLGEFLGLKFEIGTGERSDWCLKNGAGGATLTLPDSFFTTACGVWLRPESLPAPPLPRWTVGEDLPETVTVDPSVPVLAGTPSPRGDWWECNGATARLGLDVFGSAFFLLSRYEELVRLERDRHDRFPATASLAVRDGFLERPLLDEYVETLWAAMKRLWPQLERAPRQGRVRYTCDVDLPYQRSSKGAGWMLRGLAGDLIKRRRLPQLLDRIANARRARRGDFSHDPNNTFDWIMDCCEAQGLQAAFYFIAGHSGGAIDGCYELREPYIQELLRRIHDRGHEIGLHGSYNSFRDGTQLAHERRRLIEACASAGVERPIDGIRQHYLRWDSAVTPGLMQSAGFAYDTTGSFADQAGFRYGTSRAFPMWDWSENRALRLRQRPLIVMECTVIGYMNLGHCGVALEKMRTLQDRSLRFGGEFTLLWHNSRFADPRDGEMFVDLLRR